MPQFQELKDAANAFRDARDWRQFHNPKDFALSVTLEAAELLEHFQWKNGDQVTKYLADGGKEVVKEEMADVLIYLLMMADDLNIDLYEAVLDKLRKQDEKYPVDKANGVSKKYTTF